MSELETLLGRATALKDPDRSFDAVLGVHFDFPVEGMSGTLKELAAVTGIDHIVKQASHHQSILCHALPRFTASIDGAMALVNHVLQSAPASSGEPQASWSSVLERGMAILHRTHGLNAPIDSLPRCIIVAMLVRLIEGGE